MATSSPARTVAEALGRIEAFDGPPITFSLSVHESLLDPVGVNMALITDRALARGWEPDGFTQHNGYRVFRYKELA